jgi:hypothetical protein
MGTISSNQREFVGNLGVIDHCLKEMERLLVDCVPAEASARIRPLLEEIRALVKRIAEQFPPPSMEEAPR